MSNKTNRNIDYPIIRKAIMSILIAIIFLMNLSSPAIAQATKDAVLILHFDEGSGSVVKDSSGNGNDGTIYGATWIDGISGKALRFDGVDDYVDFGNLGLTNSKGTIEVWVSPKRIATGYYGQIFSVRDNTLKNNIQFYVGEGSGTKMVSFYMAIDGTPVIDISGQITQNEWYHVVITQDGTTSKMYIDGVLQPKTGSGEWFDDLTGINEYAVGRLRHMSNYYFNGAIDELAFYSRTLTADEVKAHYLAKKAGYPTTALSLTKTASPYSIKQEQKTTVKITVENTGTTAIKDIEVVDMLSANFEFVSGETSGKYGNLMPGESRTFQYTLRSGDTGKFDLGQTTATYADEEGNYHTVKSNSPKVEVLSPLEKPEIPAGEEGEKKGTPGFELIFAIAGLLTVVILRKRK